MAEWLDRIAPRAWQRWSILIVLLAISGWSTYAALHPKRPGPSWPPTIAPLVKHHDIPGLTAELDDPDLKNAIAAANALVYLQGKEAGPKLGEVLATDSRAEVRQAAASLLSIVGDPAHEDALRQALRHDASATVRAAAVRAMGILKGIDAPPGLEEAVKDNNRELFNQLCSQTGPADLIEALDDPDVYVRRYAHQAYQTIFGCRFPYKEDDPESLRKPVIEQLRKQLPANIKGWLLYQERTKSQPHP